MVSSRWFFFLVALEGLVMSPGEVAYPSPFPQEKEADYWYKLAKDDIYEALHLPRNEGVAKNVILFLGDGLGITVGTASRILKGQRQGYSGEEGYLLWERFPNIGLVKTYNIDKQVSDSAGTATAYLTGVKGNYRTLGVNGKVEEGDCAGSLKPENRLDSILKWAQDAGKDTGLVTTAQVTHASPAGLYAKTPSRYWQCDTKMAKAGEHTRACKDIARQLVEDEPGRNINVIFGGGRQELGAPTLAEAKTKCPRSDGRDLVEEWATEKREQGKTAAYVTSAGMLRDLEVQDVDYIMGLFGEIHLPYEIDEEEDAPSLAQMVQAAIRRLSRNKEGFFLMVEGARIDHAMHDGHPKRALTEVLAMEDALQKALDLVNLQETLIVVTADHSHVMTMNGYPQRGNDIFGVVENNPDVTDGMPYTTLMFTTGHGFNYTWDGEKVMRRNLTGVDTKDKDFEPLAAVPTVFGEETHGGEDVAAFAVGPMAHLFHRIHEQTYVAHVMAYSSCVGPYSHCDRPKPHSHKKDDIEEEKGTGEQAGEHDGEQGEEQTHTEHVGSSHGMDEEEEHAEHTEEHGAEHSESTKTEPAESEQEEHRPTGEYDHAEEHVTDDDHSEHHIVEIVPLEQDNDSENENIPQEEEEERDEEEGEESTDKAKGEENEESDEENGTGGGKSQAKHTEQEEVEEGDGEKEEKEEEGDEEEEEEEEAEEGEKKPNYIVNKIKAPRERGAASSIVLNYVLFLLTTFSAVWMAG